MLVYICKSLQASRNAGIKISMQSFWSAASESSLRATFSRNQHRCRAFNELHTSSQPSDSTSAPLPPVLVVWLVSLLGYQPALTELLQSSFFFSFWKTPPYPNLYECRNRSVLFFYDDIEALNPALYPRTATRAAVRCRRPLITTTTTTTRCCYSYQ